MLAYLGRDDWKQADFLPYVAYLDKQAGGKPRDWFYDAWLMLMYGGAPSGGTYADGTANKTDWESYLDLLFAPQQNLAALNACVDDVGKQLGDPNHTCPVIIMIPYLDGKLKSFGSLDGKAINPANQDDRVRAFRWCVDQFLSRWRPQAYPHLKLWGFYWMMEGVYAQDEAVVRGTADIVRARGLGFHWIPWFSAGGFDKWRALGFDLVVMQPNYAFLSTPPGAVVPDEDRLTQNANLARQGSLGVEMELDAGIEGSPAKRLNLQLYLNHGVEELDGYMSGAVRAYYQATDYIARLYKSDLPDCNRLYDDLYRFHKGTYQRRAVSLCEGAAASVNGKPAPWLTSGAWATREDRASRVPAVTAPATLDVDLGALQRLGDVRVHLVARGEGQPARPTSLRLLTSPDGKQYHLATEAAGPRLEPVGAWREGFALLTCTPHFARHVRVELQAAPGATVAPDQVVIFPAPHLLWAAPCTIQGRLTGSPAEAAVALTDGRLSRGVGQAGSVSFRDAGGAVTLQLEEAWVLSRALAHAHWQPGAAAPRCRVSTLAAGRSTHVSPWAVATGQGEGWVQIPLPSPTAQALRFELSGGPDVGWDELQVLPTPNLAQGKPYQVIPGFPAKYPDPGLKKLTDGALSEKGFGDGKTVGWYDQTPVITLDLGSVRPLNAVRVHSEGGGYAAVNHPAAMEAWGSEDGEQWRLLSGQEPQKQVTASEKLGEELMELAWLRQDFPPWPVRYLRLKLQPRGWLMLSEVEALVGEGNVARGCSYYLAPQPKSEQSYADDGVRLTDGETSRPSDGWSKVVGWMEGRPEIVVDLLKPTRVSLVRAHVLGGGNGGVYFPLSVAVATSEDGKQWSAEERVENHLPESGAQSLVAFMDLRLSPRVARYLRLRLERKAWVMIDEVQAFGEP